MCTPEGYRDYALRLANQPAEPLIEEDNLDGDALEMAFAYTILRDTRAARCIACTGGTNPESENLGIERGFADGLAFLDADVFRGAHL